MGGELRQLAVKGLGGSELANAGTGLDEATTATEVR